MNVLFVVLDSVRPDHLSCYGYDRDTSPSLESLCEDAVRYENAFSAAPWTPLSHASMFTGRWVSDHGIVNKRGSLDPEHVTMAEWLRNEGFETLAVSPTPTLPADGPLARGFDTYYDLWKLPVFRPQNVREFYQYYLRFGFHIARAGLKHYLWNTDRSEVTNPILRSHISRCAARNRPFFAFTNYLAAHNPYKPPAPYRDRFEEFDPDAVDADLLDHLSKNGAYRYLVDDVDIDDAHWQALQDWYDGSIAYADDKLGELVDVLKRKDVYDETMIVVTADHGEHFGEHGRVYHHFSLYDELIHVPLVVKFPGNEHAGTVVDDLVSHVDIFPTVQQVVAGDEGGHDVGLPPVAEHGRDHVFAEYKRIPKSVIERHVRGEIDSRAYDDFHHDLQCVRTADAKYVRRHGATDEFYDFEADPEENRSVIHSRPDESAALQELLDSRLVASLEDEPDAETESELVKRRLEHLGYR